MQTFKTFMKKKHSSKSEKTKKIVRERIRELFDQARNVFKEDKKLADRYVRLARELAMKYKASMPSDLKRQFCKHCHAFLFPPVNARVRTREGHVIYLCKECKHFMRFPYIKEQKAKRKSQKKDTAKKE